MAQETTPEPCSKLQLDYPPQLSFSALRGMVGWRNGNASVSGLKKLPAEDSGFDPQVHRRCF